MRDCQDEKLNLETKKGKEIWDLRFGKTIKMKHWIYTHKNKEIVDIKLREAIII